MRTSCECSRAPRSRPSTSSAARHPGLIRLPPHWGPPPFLPSVFQLTSCATCCTCARHLARASLARAPLLDMCARATVPKVQVCTVSSHSAALLRLLHCCRPPFKPPMCQGSSARVHGPAGFCTVAPGRPTLDTTRGCKVLPLSLQKSVSNSGFGTGLATFHGLLLLHSPLVPASEAPP